jgi:hypothetical protein
VRRGEEEPTGARPIPKKKTHDYSVLMEFGMLMPPQKALKFFMDYYIIPVFSNPSFA